MRKSKRFIAFFFAFTLLFSCVFTPSASDNDSKFDSYINMGDNAIKNGYAIPHLFRQNGVYSNMQKFPLVVKGGVEYVPLSMFILFPYVDVTYSKTDDNFFLFNTKNNHYISFKVQEGIASTYDGDLLMMPTPIFNQTRYIPARTVAVVLGFVCETYDDPEKGIYAFRISDGKTGKTIEDLLSEYIRNADQGNDSGDSGTQNEEIEVVPPDAGSKDPLEKLAQRNVGLCYAGLSYEKIDRVIKALDSYKLKASFSFTTDEILSRPQLVRDLYSSGHSLFVTADAAGENAKEYADSFIDGLEQANNAMKLVMKKKTRMCTLPLNIPDEIKSDKDFIFRVKAAGYLVFNPTLETGDGPEFSGSAYNISSKIKKQITNGFAEDEAGTITALVWCSDKTYYYTIDTAMFVAKYRQFDFFAMNEAFLYDN